MQGFSQAADNNKTPILEVLSSYLKAEHIVFEIGSGAGQHAIHMASALPHIRWLPSDRNEVLPTLQENIRAHGSMNIAPPQCFDLERYDQSSDTECVAASCEVDGSKGDGSEVDDSEVDGSEADQSEDDRVGAEIDSVFSANVIHIVTERLAAQMIQASTDMLRLGGLLFLYGPFKYRGDFTSLSNANFDIWLKERNPKSGVRDFEWVCSRASQGGLELLQDHLMPANNQLLVFQKQSAGSKANGTQ